MIELKPCPFCRHVGLDFAEGSTFRWIVASCAGCGASRGETRIQTLGDGTKEEWMAQAEADAIEQWNTRAEQPVASEPSSGERVKLIAKLKGAANGEFIPRIKLCEQAADMLSSDAKPASEQHPDDKAVDFFAQAMRAKMKKQREKGYGGWESCPTERLQKMLVDHIAKGDPVDVANFAMMLYCRGDATAAPASEPVAVPQGLLKRAEDLHEMACMPWAEAEKLALSEIDIEDSHIDELSGNTDHATIVTLLSEEEVREFVRTILIYGQPLLSATSPAPVGIKKENQ